MTAEVLPSALTAAALARMPGIRHGFFTRAGGVSRGSYASLNCGVGSCDDRSAVLQNRARALAALNLPDAGLATPHQVHSADAVTADAAWSPDDRPRADAVVTTTPGLAVGVLTADCAPVLLADADAGVVAAAHAGWRGALAGIVAACIERMAAAGAERGRIAAAVGPCIGYASYTVGHEFPEPFMAESAANGRFFQPADDGDGYVFDLAGYVAAKLDAERVGSVAVMGRDTYGEPDAFFSHRRAHHAGERDYGRLLSAVARAPA